MSKVNDNKQQLILTNPAGETITLTADRLKKLFALTELSLRQESNKLLIKKISDDELTLRLLGRSGLQTPQQVILFLNSPEGRNTLALLNEELAEIAAIRDDLMHQIILEQLKKKCSIALLLLGLLHKRKVHAHQLLEMATAEAIEKNKHHDKEKKQAYEEQLAAEALKQTNEWTSEVKIEAIHTYQAEAIEVEKTLNHKLKEAKSLSELIMAVEAQHLATKEKYNAYHEFIDAIHKVFNREMGVEQIQSKIDQLSTLINEKNIEAMNLADQDDMENFLLVRESIIQLTLQMGELEDLLSVKNGGKILYDKHLNIVDSFAEADYVVNKELSDHIQSKEFKIVEKDGVHYLINKNQTLENMSPDAQNTAKNEYDELKSKDIMSLKNLMKHNLKAEEQVYHAKKETLFAESDLMQDSLMLLQNQLLELQATASNIELSLKQTKPMPILTIAPVLSPKPECVTDTYRQMLILMREHPTAISIAWLRSNLENNNSSKDIRKQLEALRPGTPIAPETMRFLLASNPIFNSMMQQNFPSGPATPAPLSTAPTPFSIRPNPRNTQ